MGVGGSLLGGGLSYYRSLRGWAANDVINYEVVTAEGQIVQANQATHSDLFWALKGGSGNFGFVTSFDLRVYPLINIYGGNFNTTGADALVKASASYADSLHGGVADPLSAVNPTVQLALDTRQRTGFTNIFYNMSISSAPEAIKNFTSLPGTVDSTVSGPRALVGFISETAAFPNDMR